MSRSRAFIASWNEFIAALIFMGNETRFTIPIMLVGVRQGHFGATPKLLRQPQRVQPDHDRDVVAAAAFVGKLSFCFFIKRF